MPNIGVLLKSEISRLCRKEIRAQIEPLRKTATGYRHDIAALKRQVQELQRQVILHAKKVASTSRDQTTAPPERPSRFVAKGLRSLRARLGLSAPELARLMGVSDQSIYNWELKKTVPRKEQLAILAAIRKLGKREARKRLESLSSQRMHKRR